MSQVKDEPTTMRGFRAAVFGSSGLGAVISRRGLIFLAVFILLALFFAFQSDGTFLTARNLSLMLRQASILAVVATGVAMLLIMSEIDLSIGSSVFLCGVVAATLSTTTDLPLPIIIIITLVSGVGIGAVLGFCVVVLGIPSFIATLAGLLAFRGVGLLWTNAATVGPVSPEFTALSESYIPPAPSIIILGVVLVLGIGAIIGRNRRITRHRVSEAGQGTFAPAPISPWRTLGEVLGLAVPVCLLAWIAGNFLGIPTAIIWVIVVVTALATLMGRTVFGRRGYLLGTNREAATYSGIAIKRSVFVGFLIMGAIYGVAGILLTARLGSSTPGAGEFMELDAIAAAVIGGISLRGGTGVVGGAVVGALLLTVINNGMSILNISSFSQLVIKGLILVIALAADAYFQRRSAR